MALSCHMLSNRVSQHQLVNFRSRRPLHDLWKFRRKCFVTPFEVPTSCLLTHYCRELQLGILKLQSSAKHVLQQLAHRLEQ